jgi:hypothetical protein
MAPRLNTSQDSIEEEQARQVDKDNEVNIGQALESVANRLEKKKLK